MHTNTDAQQNAAGNEPVVVYLPKPVRRGDARTAVSAGTDIRARRLAMVDTLSDTLLASHLISAAEEAQSAGDAGLAEHLVEVGYDLLEWIAATRRPA